MPVGARVHLSKQIDLMAEATAIRFVVPALEPRNAGANAAGGEGDEVISNAAIVGACAARAAESKGDGIGGAPKLEPHATSAVEGKCVVEGNGALRKCKDERLINVSIKRGSYQNKLMSSPFRLCVRACLDHPFPLS
jgi:hypothetical protein